MLEKCLAMLESQKSAYKSGQLEYLVAELLKDMAQTSPQAADLLAHDLELEKMDIKAAGNKLLDHAKKNKSGQSYGMCDAEARQILREFYHIPEESFASTTPAEAKPKREAINLLDLL